jgi:outer membrane lipoprotein-sorting protein
MKKYLITLLLIAAVTVSAQTKDPRKLLDAVRQKFNKVNDYKADALVKLDMSFIKVPEMNAKVFFKKPDKVKVEAEGFAMIPKQGLKFSPADLLKEDFTALYVRSETIDNRKIDIVKAIPNGDSSEVILSTFWVDAAESVIRKVETTSKKGGTTQIELSYDSYEFGLPSQLKLSFNLGNIQMPVNAPNQSNENEAADTGKKNRRRRGLPDGTSLKGSVIMTYKNYQVNKGISDSFFIEKEKEKKEQLN